MLLVGIHGCQVIELCAVQGTQVLVVALRHTPLACIRFGLMLHGCYAWHDHINWALRSLLALLVACQAPRFQPTGVREVLGVAPSLCSTQLASYHPGESSLKPSPVTARTGSSAGAVCSMSGLAPSKPMYLQKASAAGWPQAVPLFTQASTCLPSMFRPPAEEPANFSQPSHHLSNGSCPCGPQMGSMTHLCAHWQLQLHSHCIAGHTEGSRDRLHAGMLTVA